LPVQSEQNTVGSPARETMLQLSSFSDTDSMMNLGGKLVAAARVATTIHMHAVSESVACQEENKLRQGS